jgi:hypothetical protein
MELASTRAMKLGGIRYNGSEVEMIRGSVTGTPHQGITLKVGRDV